jgi:hypothetical protein
MQFAIVDNKRTEPKKNLRGNCPLCNASVLARCGSINTHHWAHAKNENCDSWSEAETYWHKSWKGIFPEKNREVVITKCDKMHFADIRTENNVIIELQNSSIKPDVIKARESFYGKRMLWIINGLKYIDQISIKNDEILYDDIKRLKKEDKIPFITSQNIPLSTPEISSYLNHLDDFEFLWNNPVKRWKYSERPIFLDIPGEYILWIVSGKGEKHGKMKVKSKKEFIEKYGGNYSTFLSLVK